MLSASLAVLRPNCLEEYIFHKLYKSTRAHKHCTLIEIEYRLVVRPQITREAGPDKPKAARPLLQKERKVFSPHGELG